ncbi:DUF4974 domain-containing protein [Chitinophaga sp. Mgbs1]|uniref:DUF4974 domain-containing protein n=1 Tax=Chitinophaga solisilvae TaxID=1233460 RepID=A0A3S1BH35_9BACT|nr:DUF4974 domain-containing protein [Chitinophaga solisilvae]
MEANYFNEQADDLIACFLSGNATPEEQEQLKHWLEASPDNRLHFQQLRDAWLAAGTSRGYDEAAAWHTLQRQLATPAIRRWKPLLRMAASWALPFLLGGGIVFSWLAFRKNTGNSGMVTVTSPKGATTRIELADGTEVWLNAGSRLQYAASYNMQAREVQLEGEAFFKVQTNPRKPFTVKAADLKILALGTSFNVKAYPEDKDVVTTLVEGAVKIDGSGAAIPFDMMMKPHQNVVYRKPESVNRKASPAGNPAMPEPVVSKQISDTEIYTAWKDGSWIVTGQALEELAVTMERRFNVNVVFNDEELKAYRFSGTFRQETLEQILNILKLTAPLSYSIEGGTVTLNVDKILKEKYANALKAAK